MVTSITRPSGTKTLSSLTLLEPEPCMPMKRSSPQSGSRLSWSLGTTKKTWRIEPSGLGARLPPMKWLLTGTPEAKGQTPSTT